VVCALLVCGVLPARCAAARSLEIESFSANIRIDAGGNVDVIETIRARFTGKWTSLYRTIPVDYLTGSGFGQHLRLWVAGCTDDGGHALRYHVERDGGDERVRISVPAARDATRTVVLSYVVANGLRFFADHDELNWNITGDRWDAAIEAASAWITLPPAAHGLRAVAFNGVHGAQNRDAEVVLGETDVWVRLPKGLRTGQELSAIVGWDKGLVAEPTAGDVTLMFVADNWPLAVPIVLLPV